MRYNNSMNPFGVHYIPVHPSQAHTDLIRGTRPSVVKLVSGNEAPDVQMMASMYEIASNAVHVYRNHPMSEQHGDMWVDPIGTAQRHVANWVTDIRNRQSEAKRRKLVIPEFDQIMTLGINEPVIELFPRSEDGSNYAEWLAMTRSRSIILDQYMTTYIWESKKYGLPCGVGNFSGGQPANLKPGDYATYAWFPKTQHAIEANPNFASLVVHEYWDIPGPGEMVNWWTYRFFHCDWATQIYVLECGVDREIRAADYIGSRGWMGHLSPQVYVAQIEEYLRGCCGDPRFRAATPFTLDGARWDSFLIDSLGAELFAMVNRLMAHPTTPATPPPLTPPVVPPTHTVNFPNVSAGPIPVRLIYPLPVLVARKITQRFGENASDYARFGLAGHPGIDFAVPIGTDVLAADAGVVLEAGDLPDLGRYVKLQHPWGESVYAHLNQLSVQPGDRVLVSQPIGKSGNTGNSTGPHLHFAIRRNPYTRGAPYDGFTDPQLYLPVLAEPPAGAIKPIDGIPQLLAAAAAEFKVDFGLLASLAMAESSWQTSVVSPAGAIGVMQLMQPTFDEWAPLVGATAILNPRDNIRVAARYWRWLLDQVDGDERKALWAYNWGIGRVLAGQTPPVDTRAFATKVLHGRDLLAGLYAAGFMKDTQ